MAPRSKPTAELAAFLKRFARHEDSDLRAWTKSLRTGSEHTLFGVWRACTDGKSMLLALGADLRKKDQGSEAHRRLILATRACARLALVHVPPNEPRVAQALAISAKCAEQIRGFYPRPPYRDPEDGSIDEATYWMQIVDDPSVDPAVRQAAGSRVLEIEAEIQGG